MATSLHKMQYALKTCEEHEEKELTMFCKSCKKKICSLCFRLYHISHEWDLISELAKEKRKTLPGICRKIKEDDISELKKQVELFETLITTTESNSQKAEEDLNKVRISLIKDINELVDRKIDDNQKRTVSTKKEYKEKLECLKKKLQYLEMMSNALGTESDTFSDHDLLDMEQEMMTELDNANSYNAEKYSHCKRFVPGEINVETVVGMTGEIHNVTVEETSTFKNFSSPIVSIAPESQGTAWISEYDSNTADLITERGEKLKSLNTKCIDLTVLRNGNTALTHHKDCEIIIMNNKEVIRKINTKPLHPQCISKTDNEDILVTLRDGGDLYSLLPTSRRIVQRMTLTGIVLHTYEFEEDKKTRLFLSPGKIAENKNNDVCVINITSSTSSYLVVLHRDGGVKFTYRGQCVSPDKFLSCDVACDSKCHIIISEMWSKSLQLLSSRGQFIGVIRSFTAPPWSVALCGEKLWVGLHDGAVQVYIYESN